MGDYNQATRCVLEITGRDSPECGLREIDSPERQRYPYGQRCTLDKTSLWSLVLRTDIELTFSSKLSFRRKQMLTSGHAFLGLR